MDRMVQTFVTVTLVLSAPVSGLEIPFSVASAAATFSGVRQVAVGDVNGDGRPDLVVTADTADEVAWLENTGSSWVAHTIASSIDGAWGVAVGDINSDGTLDVVVGARDANSVGWWSNDAGDGSSWTVEVIAATATGVLDVEVGDIDGDGDLDVAGAVPGADDIRWWQQTPSGWTGRVLAGNAVGVNEIELGDADSDGYLDVFAAVPGFDMISWWVNPRPGVGVPWSRTDLGTEQDVAALEVVDFDRDGDVDVIAGDRLDNTLAWWANDGTGAAGTWTRTAFGPAFGPTSAHAVDLDLDGDLDVLVTGDLAGGAVGWYENDTQTPQYVWREIATGGAPGFATAADLDADGDPDVISTDTTAGTIDVTTNLMAHRGATFDLQHAGAFGPGNQIPEPPARGDIDGDGDLDVAVLDQDTLNGGSWRRVMWLENPGQPSQDGLAYLISHVVEAGVAPWYGFENATDVQIGDLDGDGDGDLLIGQQGAVNLFLTWCENTAGDGSAWTCAPTWEATTGSEHDIERDMALGDIDGDGDLDMAAYIEWWNLNGTYGLRWFENLGDMSQSANWAYHEIDQIQLRDSIQIIDIDGDGDQDVLGSEDGLKIYLNSGGGTSWTQVSIGLDEPSFAFGDIDLDGDLDIVSHTSSAYRWWEQVSPMSWTQRDIEALPFGGGDIPKVDAPDLADMDLDGDLDVVGSYEITNGGSFVDGAYVWYENMLREVAFRHDRAPETGWRRHDMAYGEAAPAYALDLDGDADPELIIHELSFWQFVWTNLGATVGVSLTDLINGGEVTEQEDTALAQLSLEHQGRLGDREAVLSRLQMRFTGGTGTPLTQQQLDTLVGSLRIRSDDGDGVAEPNDPEITTLSSASVSDGVLVISYTGVTADRTIPCCEEPKPFSVWLEPAAGAASAGLPSPVRISFEGSVVNAIDAVDELPITAEPLFANDAIELTLTDGASSCTGDPASGDSDSDGLCNDIDICPSNPDPGQEDTDGDGSGDACDPYPTILAGDANCNGLLEADDMAEILIALPAGTSDCDGADTDNDLDVDNEDQIALLVLLFD